MFGGDRLSAKHIAGGIFLAAAIVTIILGLLQLPDYFGGNEEDSKGVEASGSSSATQTATTSATQTATTPVPSADTSSPRTESETSAAPPTIDNETLVIVNILPGSGGKIAPDTYREGSTPGFGIEVFTPAGQLDYQDGCYVAWTLVVDGTQRVTGNSRCDSGGVTPFSTGPLPAGDAVVSASISTDWGATALEEYRFLVVVG